MLEPSFYDLLTSFWENGQKDRQTKQNRVEIMGHSWDIWRQKMVTNLHKQQQRIPHNTLIILISFVVNCCQLNILGVC